MEIQLQELIEQIKKDGVEAAESQAAAIVQAAKDEAEGILAEARAKADKMILDAKEENERFVRVSEDSIRQAGRNLLITFRESVSRELSAIVGENVSAVYSSKDISALIVKAVEAWTKNPDAENVSVLLNSKDLEAFEGALLSAFKENMIDGITVAPSDTFDGGFRIATNNGTAYYDYSADAVVEMLSVYLNDRVAALMREAKEA